MCPVLKENFCPHEILDALNLALDEFDKKGRDDQDARVKELFANAATQLESEIAQEMQDHSRKRVQNRTRRFHQELVEVAWEPRRYLDWCMDEQEKAEYAEDLHG